MEPLTGDNIIRVARSRKMLYARHVATIGELRNAYKGRIGNNKGKRPIRRPRRRWENNIKMNLKK
jgi:hypothetical protein